MLHRQFFTAGYCLVAGLLVVSGSSLHAQTSRGSMQVRVDSYNLPGQPVQLKWTRPDSLDAISNVSYEVLVEHGTIEDHVLTNSTDAAFDALAPGLYNYRVVAHTESDSVVATGVFAVAALNVEEQADETSVRVFPNPVTRSNSKLNILLTGLNDADVTVRLYDLQGNVIDLTTLHHTGEQLVVDAREIPSGMYHCEIISSKGRWVAPVIVE